MDFEARYQQIMHSLAQGHRGLQRFTPEELAEINQAFMAALPEQDTLKLEKLLCLIEHSAALHSPFGPGIEAALNSPLPDPIIIFSLNAARKHIIEARFQQGQRLHFDFLEILKKLLHSPSPEVVEWTLRTIEECGNQGVYFLQEFAKIKPPPWKWFNAHQRAVREIITLLERRWSPFERPSK